jgi:hypothetical protein
MGNHLSGCYEDLVHCGTLRRWIRKDETDTGKREGLTTSEREEFNAAATREPRIEKGQRIALYRAEIRRVWDANFQVYGAEKCGISLGVTDLRLPVAPSRD